MNLKKMFDREVIIHLKKETEKIVLLQVKDFMQIFVKFRTEEISLHVSLPFTKRLFGGYWHVHQQKYFGAIVSKGTNWKFMVPWQKVNWHILQTVNTYFRYSKWFMISVKSITYESTRYMFFHLGW